MQHVWLTSLPPWPKSRPSRSVEGGQVRQPQKKSRLQSRKARQHQRGFIHIILQLFANTIFFCKNM
jgi:hypothetical protein